MDLFGFANVRCNKPKSVQNMGASSPLPVREILELLRTLVGFLRSANDWKDRVKYASVLLSTG